MKETRKNGQDVNLERAGVQRRGENAQKTGRTDLLGPPKKERKILAENSCWGECGRAQGAWSIAVARKRNRSPAVGQVKPWQKE